MRQPIEENDDDRIRRLLTPARFAKHLFIVISANDSKTTDLEAEILKSIVKLSRPVIYATGPAMVIYDDESVDENLGMIAEELAVLDDEIHWRNLLKRFTIGITATQTEEEFDAEFLRFIDKAQVYLAPYVTPCQNK